MMHYMGRRLMQMIPILLGVTIFLFLLFTYFGEDPARVTLGAHATPDKIALLHKKWGLDLPLWQQYLRYLKETVTLDFGRSYVTNQKLSEIFAEGAWVSAAVTLPPFLMGTIVNVAMALFVVWRRGSMSETIMTTIFTGAMSVSYLVYVLFFQYVLAYKWGLFEISGYLPGFAGIFYLILPWLIQMIIMMGPDVRLYRGMFLEEVKADYVRTARAKGLNDFKVLTRHVLRNVMIPVMTYTIVNLPFVIMGGFVVERFFGIPGIGNLLVESVNSGDFPVVKGVAVLMAVCYTLLSLLTDLLNAWIDPRIKLESH
jgi:peptide/nickel transport system permease protein